MPSAKPRAPAGSRESHSFAASFEDTMKPDASAEQTGQVPTAMADKITWTEVSLSLKTPAAVGRVPTTTSYSDTFADELPLATARAVAEGVAAIAAFPGLTGVDASIPYTLRVDCGNVNLDGELDPAQQDALRALIKTTIFKDTTLHGAIPNGAKF